MIEFRARTQADPAAPRAGRWRPHALAALAASLLLPACASTTEPLRTNSIRDDLNRGGTELAAVEHRFELKKVEALADALPVCIAYRLPGKEPWMTSSFTDTLRVVGQSAKKWEGSSAGVRLIHARMAKDTAAVFPAEVAVGFTQSVRDYVTSLPVKYETIGVDKFRATAACGDKDTIFVDRERITFYSKDFPSDLAWSGLVHIGDVLFVRIQGPEKPFPAKEVVAGASVE